MSDELERLRADLEVLQRYQAYSIIENALADLADKIASIEAPKDPWAEAKQWIEKCRESTTDLATRRQIAYTDHLNAEIERLREMLKAAVSVLDFFVNGNNLTQATNDARNVIAKAKGGKQ